MLSTELPKVREIKEVGFIMSKVMSFVGWHFITSYKPVPTNRRYVLGHF